MKNLNFIQAINDAMKIAMDIDENVICYGLGVTDPKGIFGSTLELENIYGSDRVFDVPASENAITGIAIGASLGGIKPVVTHQRADFFLLAFDQIINNAAKWRYMFDGASSVPITIRLIVGRGWGQGPTHSQNLHSMFSQVPGLKIVMPSTTSDAKGLLLSSIFDDDPVIFIEHRWLYNQTGDVPEEDFRIPLGKSNKIRKGNDITIVSMSLLTIEALLVVDELKKIDVKCDLIDLRSIKPIDWESIFESVSTTGRLLVLDTGNTFSSVSSEIITRVVEKLFNELKCSPKRIGLPDIPIPTSRHLARELYTTPKNILDTISEMLDLDVSNLDPFTPTELDDIPGNWFKGPF